MAKPRKIIAKKIAIIGTAGVPASYGGFETLADELIKFAEDQKVSSRFLIYCSGDNPQQISNYRGATLRFLRFPANGVSSIVYDALSSVDALLRGCRVLLCLGVSGAPLFPLLRLIPGIEIITNVDGVEWRREKWGYFARLYLRMAEWFAVRFSNCVIADNEGIHEYLQRSYGISAAIVSYGGDHALKGKHVDLPLRLPEVFALSLCRIEPENNVDLILRAFSASRSPNLVFVGNWNASEYGRQLRHQYTDTENLFLLDPLYDENLLFTIRSKARYYVHGHSAGGTNPSLVEMMHFGVPVLAFDCVFNRYTTDNEAFYFDSVGGLVELLGKISSKDDSADVLGVVASSGGKMRDLAQSRYCWTIVGREYLQLLGVSDS